MSLILYYLQAGFLRLKHTLSAHAVQLSTVLFHKDYLAVIFT